jgi:hypothetical protein
MGVEGLVDPQNTMKAEFGVEYLYEEQLPEATIVQRLENGFKFGLGSRHDPSDIW